MIKIKNKLGVQSKNQFTPIPEGEFSKPIQFDPEYIFHFAPKYRTDDLGNVLTAKNFADISTINNINGVPYGIPANNGVGILEWDSYRKDWYNVKSYNVIFDLKQAHNLDYIYLWAAEGKKDPLYLWGSEDGVTYKQLSQPVGDFSANGWTKFEFSNDIAKGGNKYFILGMTYEDYGLKGMVLYGRPSGGLYNKGVKRRRNTRLYKTDEHVGTNAFYFEHPEMVETVSGIHRFYVQPDWFMGDEFRNTGTAIGKPLSALKLKLHSSHMGSIDQLLQGFRNTGAKVTFCVPNMPIAFRPVGTGIAGESKGVDPGFSTVNLAHTTNPMNYTWMARIAWNFAARYGANKNIDTQYIQLQAGQPIRVGLNQIYCLEMGNEMDKWWQGAQGYANPEELAAYLSAIYDGHQGRMGPGFGIKNADPSMKVSVPSFASGDNITYVRRMLWWFDKHRGVGDYPFDIIGYHWYNSSEGSQTVGDGSGASGVPPEEGSIMTINKQWSDLRDQYCPSVEVHLTEVGYDEHLGGVFSPRKATQFERSRLKAYWLCRTYTCNQISGVDVTNQYWFANQGGERFTDMNQDEPKAGKFLSSGLTDGVQSSSDFNRFPLMSYWYVASFRTALRGYVFSHLVMRKGVANTDEVLITGADSTVWAAAYINYIDNKKIIAVWLDSTDFKTKNLTVNVSGTSTDVLVLEDAELRESISPRKDVTATPNNILSINASECPQFIVTDKIGSALLLPPRKIQTQVISNGYTSVTWEDDNIETVYVRVSRSNSLTGIYTKIYQGLSSNPEYIDTTVSNSPFYYRVEFLKEDEPVGPGFNETLVPLEQTASGVWYAATSTKYQSTTKAIHGDAVGKIQDKVGNADLLYVGLPKDNIPAIPVLNGPAKLSTTGLDIPYIKMWNLPYLGYESLDFPAVTGVPYVIGFVMELHPYGDYEALIPGSSGYIGIINHHIRAASSAYQIQGTEITKFKRVFIQVEFKADIINVYFDGVFKGNHPNDLSETHSDQRKNNAVFVNTNNACWNFFAMYDWRGADYNVLMGNKYNIDRAIMSKFNCGLITPTPHADTLSPVFNNISRTWTVDITYSNATPQQVANGKYLWLIRGDAPPGHGGNFINQRVMTSTTNILNESEYINLPASDRRDITPYVSLGDWDYIKGETKSIT